MFFEYVINMKKSKIDPNITSFHFSLLNVTTQEINKLNSLKRPHSALLF